MAEKGIIFSAPMVRALLDGRKTQTRRIVRPVMLPGVNPKFSDLKAHPHGKHGEGRWMIHGSEEASEPFRVPFAPGDRLYVREAFALVGAVDPGWMLYRASGYDEECARHGFDNPPPECEVRWKPSIHMPRWASRLWLTVTDVRVERVGAISEADAIAEGISERPCVGPYRGPDATYWSADFDHGELSRTTPVHAFAALWNSLHTNPGETWDANPWVVAVTFEVEEKGN